MTLKPPQVVDLCPQLGNLNRVAAKIFTLEVVARTINFSFKLKLAREVG